MKKHFLALCFLISSIVFVAFLYFPAAANAGPLKIAMVLWRGETQTEKGFKDGLKGMGYEVEYVTFNAEQDKGKLADIMRKEVEPNASSFNYVYCFGTTIIKMSKNLLGDKVPQIFNAVAAPVEAEIVSSMDAPGGNISGVTNRIPIEVQLEKAMKFIPFKKLGYLFNPREKNAVLFGEDLKKLAAKMNFELVEINAVPESNELEQALQGLIDKKVQVDAVFLPTDSFIISQAKLIADKLIQGKIPSIGAQEDFIKNGAVVGTVADYYEMGELAAGIVDQNQKGKKMGEIPVAKPKTAKFLINKKTCSMLGIEVPKEIADSAGMIE